MGANASVAGYDHAVDPNPVKLLPEQSLSLYGLFHAKSTLTWPDVVRHKHIHFSLCVEHGLTPAQLYSMQPDIAQWICHGKCEVSDCSRMELWSPNPFVHFHCNIGDLVLLRKQLQPEVLRRCNMTVRELRERYGLTGEIMCLLQYTPQQWIDLRLSTSDLDALTAPQFEKIFGKIARTDLHARLSSL